MTMNTPIRIFVALIAGTLTLAMASNAEKHEQCGDLGLLLSISTPKAMYQTEETVPLTFLIVNTNKYEMLLPTAFGQANTTETPASIPSGMFIICQSQKGQYLNYRDKVAIFKASGPGIPLRPGQQFTASTIDLTKFFDLAPGTYDIQLLFAKKYSGFIDAASNRITITVKGNSR
jgi:hypothetical protein